MYAFGAIRVLGILTDVANPRGALAAQRREGARIAGQYLRQGEGSCRRNPTPRSVVSWGNKSTLVRTFHNGLYRPAFPILRVRSAPSLVCPRRLVWLDKMGRCQWWLDVALLYLLCACARAL